MFLDDMPTDQGFIEIEPGMRERRKLLFYRDFLRGTDESLWCDVINLTPCLNLYWNYTRDAIGLKWECPSVWLHSAAHGNGDVYTASLYEDLRDALNHLAQHKDEEAVRYSLLVSSNGMSYDANRLGGDYQVTTTSGRFFTFSVRRGSGNRKLLLAIAWN